jgi:hypothetical protein
MNNPDRVSESLEIILGVKKLKFFDADPGFGMEKFRIRDGKNSDPGYTVIKFLFWFRIRINLLPRGSWMQQLIYIFNAYPELYFRMLFYLSRYVLILFSYFTSF